MSLRSNAPSAKIPGYRAAIRSWLADRHFTHIATLATNDPMTSTERMKDLLKEWDARVNREIVGNKWHKRPDERIDWIAFREGVGAHPHWHLFKFFPSRLRSFLRPKATWGWNRS